MCKRLIRAPVVITIRNSLRAVLDRELKSWLFHRATNNIYSPVYFTIKGTLVGQVKGTDLDRH
jgi:hypothetical protein